jgi:hypothetical protein
MKNIIEDEKYQRLIKMKVDFNKMSNTEKKAFIIERKGYIENGIGLDDNGNEFRDDEGQALFIDVEE